MSKSNDPCLWCVKSSCYNCPYNFFRKKVDSLIKDKMELKALKTDTKLIVKLCDIILALSDNVLIDFSLFSFEGNLLSSFKGKKNDFVKTLNYRAFMCEWCYSLELQGTWYNGYTACIKIKLNERGTVVDEIQD